MEKLEYLITHQFKIKLIVGVLLVGLIIIVKVFLNRKENKHK